MQSTPPGRFPDLSGPWVFEPGTVTDLWGLALGFVVLCMTLWVARRQIQIMNLQTAMMHEQSEASKRQEEIAVKQAAITEKQDRLLNEQLNRRAILTLELQPAGLSSHGGGRYRLIVRNIGTRGASGFDYELYFPDMRLGEISWNILSGKLDDAPVGLRGHEHQLPWRFISGRVRDKVHPQRHFELGEIVTTGEFSGDFPIPWLIVAKDGIFPSADGFGEVKVLAIK